MAYLRYNCYVCGNEFYAKSRKAKYCGNGCKQKNWRKENDLKITSKSKTMHMDDVITLQAIGHLSPEAAQVIKAAWQGGHPEIVKAVLVLPSYKTFMDDLFRAGFWNAVNDLAPTFGDVIVDLI